MKQTEYNIKSRQCKTNYSPDPWGELKKLMTVRLLII